MYKYKQQKKSTDIQSDSWDIDFDVNQKLKQIKSMVNQILDYQHKNRDLNKKYQKHSPYRIKVSIHKYQKSEQLQTQNKTLLYQLNLLYNILTRLQIDNQHKIYKICKEDLNNQITLAENLSRSEQKVQKIERSNMELGTRVKDLEKQVEVLRKQNMEMQKKLCNLENSGNGNMAKLRKCQDKIKEQQIIIAEMTKLENRNSQELKKLYVKNKILQDLNTDSEDKLADLLTGINIRNGGSGLCQMCNKNKQNKIIDQERKRKDSRTSKQMNKQNIGINSNKNKSNMSISMNKSKINNNQSQNCKQICEIQHKYNRKVSNCEEYQQQTIQDDSKHNISTTTNNKDKIQLYAAKQEIRKLKNKIQEMHKQKQQIKNRHLEKQAIFEKMMTKKSTI